MVTYQLTFLTYRFYIKFYIVWKTDKYSSLLYDRVMCLYVIIVSMFRIEGQYLSNIVSSLNKVFIIIVIIVVVVVV